MKTAIAEISKEQALDLWKQLQTHFLNTQRVIEEIIENRAWEPLGYSTFAEAWTAQMVDVTLAVEIRPYVVYQLLAEGATDEQIAASVKGVGVTGAAGYRRQRDNDVPESLAKRQKWYNKEPDATIVREHQRKKPAAPDTLHIPLGVRKLGQVKKAAEKLGVSPVEFAVQAIEFKMREKR